MDIGILSRLVVDVDEVACVCRAVNVKPLIVDGDDGGDVGAKHTSSSGKYLSQIPFFVQVLTITH
ncbi:unnamed protein product [Meloidogyne enterolobii]|uniref:Uncharacterized protein n=1 Tax=Meloidogyne enterolobii TaxID=390850 RepID=A0ACB1ADB0_MELEN